MIQNNDIYIKNMTTCDIDKVAQIEKDIFSIPWSKNGFIESLNSPNNYFLVAVCDNNIVGYIGFYSVLDEGYIYNVAVDEKYRKRHIATKLLKKSIEMSIKKNLSFLSLEVRISNKIAIQLYKKNGFENMGIRKGFYDRPKEDALIMTRKFYK